MELHTIHTVKVLRTLLMIFNRYGLIMTYIYIYIYIYTYMYIYTYTHIHIDT